MRSENQSILEIVYPAKNLSDSRIAGPVNGLNYIMTGSNIIFK